MGKSTIDIADEAGVVVHVPGTEIVQLLVPSESREKEGSSYSGNYGMDQFPFHTDMAHWYIPPRFLLLRCVKPSALVATKIMLAAPLYSLENKSDVRRSLYRPRRRLNGRLNSLRIVERCFFRWDTLFLQPLSGRARELQERISQRISEADSQDIVLAKDGDCILIDNWNTLHSRSAVPPEAASRVIERVYLSAIKE